MKLQKKTKKLKKDLVVSAQKSMHYKIEKKKYNFNNTQSNKQKKIYTPKCFVEYNYIMSGFD